ncbi:MAG: tRNA lysidine(34) synthetase TilS [Sandaracinaceae bacterium]|nr:tRNA lysidine(34) synthetase TilS [Sandaracinaceae bacterium]
MRRTVRERALFSAGARVLVAVSGGPDSAALLSALARLSRRGALPLTLHAASVDHGLREDAAADVDVARALAEQLEVPFHPLAIQVSALGGSLMARARAARYAALRELAGVLGADAIAVGHTLDDQAETVLSRLLRGASITGLAGIEPRRADGVVRPLIDCRRAEVHAHVARHRLPHVADPSNRDPRFERARLRETILPALASEDPRVVEHLARLADDARAMRGLLDAEADAIASDSGSCAIAGSEPVRARAVSRWIERLTGAPAKRAHLDALLRGDTALLPGGWIARPDGARIVAEAAGDHPTRARRSRALDASGLSADGSRPHTSLDGRASGRYD